MMKELKLLHDNFKCRVMDSIEVDLRVEEVQFGVRFLLEGSSLMEHSKSGSNLLLKIADVKIRYHRMLREIITQLCKGLPESNELYISYSNRMSIRIRTAKTMFLSPDNLTRYIVFSMSIAHLT